MREEHFLVVSICWLAVAGLAHPAAAQQPAQEKRIALVVGNGDYQKAPLPTAANDAGLIAQTLQAAGFDVFGARDLDGDTLRNRFRDFVKKAESVGAGHGRDGLSLRLGDAARRRELFIPVDSTIARDTDIPIEGLRISDYIAPARLAAAEGQRRRTGCGAAAALHRRRPADRQRPRAGRARAEHADSVQRRAGHGRAEGAGALWRLRAGAGGNDPHRRPAAARGVQSRASARQRNTKGAQVPWDAQKVAGAVHVLRSCARAPRRRAARSGRRDRDKPIRDLGAQDAYTAALERDTCRATRISSPPIPTIRMAKRVRAIVAARREAITWRRTYLADTPRCLLVLSAALSARPACRGTRAAGWRSSRRRWSRRRHSR